MKRGKKSFWLFAGILLLLLGPWFQERVFAAEMEGLPSLSAAGVGEIINEASTIDGRYDFTPLIGSNTRIRFGSTDGTVWDNLYCTKSQEYAKCCSKWWPAADVSGWSNVRSFTPYASRKGKMYVEYTNVGENHGESVTLRIWLEDWQNTIVPEGYEDVDAVIVSVDHNKPVIDIKELLWIKVRFAYYDSKGNPLSVKGHFTLSDLDFAQGFYLADPTEHIYLTKKADDRLIYDARTEAIWSAKRGSGADGGTTPDNDEGWVTYTFEGPSQTIVFYNGGTFSKIVKPGGGVDKPKKWPDDYAIDPLNPFSGWHGASREKATGTGPWFTSEFGYTSEVPCHLSKVGDLVVKKMDAETKEALSGAEFLVYRWKNNTWSEWKKMNWVEKTGSYLLEGIRDTDSENGKFKVKETKNPAGYGGTWETEFKVEQEGTQTIRFEADNTRKTGTLRIRKTEQGSKKALSGAVYQIVADGDIRTQGGTVLLKDKAVVAELTTDTKGEAAADGLEYGTYRVREKAAPKGYALDPTEKKVTIGEQTSECLIEFTNQKNRFVLQKVSSGDGRVLSGAVFRIWTKDGSFDETKKTDQNGKIELTGLTDGIWYYQETAAPEGYLTDGMRREFTVEDGKMDGKSELSVTLENDGTHLVVEKVDAESGKRISGAKLVLKDQDGNRVDSWTSGESGPHELEKIKPGSYVLVEEAAPDGYLTADPVSFVLEAKKEVQTVTMKDLACETLTITKRIKADEITWAHGNPTFLFSVKGTDLYGKAHTYECYITFTKAQADKATDKDGYTEQSVQIRGIPAGKDYQVQEKKVLRYSLVKVTGTKNVAVKKLEEPAFGKDPAKVFSVSVNLCGHPKESEVVFENQKYRWDDYGHNSIVKNRIPLA